MRKRKQFLRLVDAILAGEIEQVVLAHQDRLARFGYALLVHLCQTHHCQLVVMNTEQLSPEQELVQDLITPIKEIGNDDLLQHVKEQLCKFFFDRHACTLLGLARSGIAF